MLKLGTQEITKLMLGGVEINKMMLGQALLYESLTFDDLLALTHPMVVATKGNNPLETGRYPQPTTVLGLSGVDQKVQVDHTDDFNLQSFTFTTWVNASTWDNGGQTVLFVKPFSSHLSPYYEYGLIVTPTAISFWRQGVNFSLPETLPLGTWVHVALVYGNSSIALYINGGLEHSQSISTFNVTHWGKDIYLFGQGNLSGNSLIGHSSETCLYSETLTADEVAMDMAGDNPHNPLFCLPLNQTSGTVALDRNDNANPGTLINGASWVVDNTLPWQADVTNEEGYTLGTGSNGAAVGVIIPPSTIDPTKDCLGNNLQFSGSVYPVIPAANGPNKNCYQVTELGDYTAATVNLGAADDIADSDTKASVLTLTNNRVFKNDTTNEIVAFQDTLTGDDFDKADSYTE